MERPMRQRAFRLPTGSWNTIWMRTGLPPGPIGNPGKASIAAAMKPDGSDYFYFVAKDARTHVFSRTYAEHARAVDKYQK